MKKSSIIRPVLSTSLQTNISRFKNSIFIADLINSLHIHATIITVIILFAIARIIFSYVYSIENIWSWSSWFVFEGMKLMTTIFLTFFFCGRAFYIMIAIRPEYLTRYLLNDFRKNFINSQRIILALPIYLLIPIFISTFSFFKTMIPVINPFSWDYEFFVLDGALHGGIQPWQLLQPILGRPFITSVINFFYNLWFFVMYMVLLWQAFSLRDLRVRMQFFLTFIGAWILLGNGLAILFSSVGPCYYGRVVGLIDPFQPLMDYLRAANEMYPVWSLHIQELLWDNYVNGRAGFAKGISAMPSLHVSMSVLFALVGWKNGRILGIAFSIFAIIIIIGSVHLGWHYAIDDYVAIILTLIIWKIAGCLINSNDTFCSVSKESGQMRG